jgi:hypothetical protein
VYGIVGSVRGKIKFTSGPSTSNHSIQIIINYTIV